MKKGKHILLALSSVLILGACSGGQSSSETDTSGSQEQTSQQESSTTESSQSSSEEEGSSSEEAQESSSDSNSSEEESSGSGSMSMGMNMNHKREGTPAPEDAAEAENPKYPVGSQAEIVDAHMEMMNGATATISGAYDTTLFTISFTPEGSEQPIEDHKWVVQEEVETEDGSPAEVGDTVLIHADHMEGMQGQTGEITGKQEGPAYMVDFQPTDGSEPFTNHKWVSENELQPIEEEQTSQSSENE